MKRVLALVSVLALPLPLAEAGPWALGRGHYYTKASFGYMRARTLAAPDGTSFTIPLFVRNDVYLYGTYGISDRFDVIANVPLLRSSDLAAFGKESGFGDIQFGGQYQFARSGSTVFGVRVLLQAPTGDETRAEGILPTGSGTWEGTAVAGVGSSFAGGKLYGYAEAGYGYRGSSLRDGVVYEAQLGWNARSWMILAFNLRGVEPFSKAAPNVAIGSPVGVSDRVTYTAYGPTLILKLPSGLGFQFDVESAANTRNIATGAVFRAGVSLAR